MIANYHTHTVRCNHAEGTDESYVRHAIQAGLKILGFSDHSPYPFGNGYRSRIRMDMDELAEYCRSISALKEKYAQSIQIHIGLEAEYYPAHFQDLMAYVRDSQVEYLIMGQHWNFNEYDAVYNGRSTADEEQLIQYCRQVLRGLETGYFSYLAHPDLLYFTGEASVYQKHIGNFCRELAKMEIPLEINLGGMRAGCHYPNPEFWRFAAEAGCKAVIGIDAHRPEQLLDKKSIAGEEFAKKLGIELLPTVELHSVR